MFRRAMSGVRPGLILAVLAFWLLAPESLFPQDSLSVSGVVLDAATLSPLSGASVVVEPYPAGVMPAANRASPFLRSSRSTVTDDDGVYRFHQLTGGSYRLVIRRLGYRPRYLEIQLEGARLRLSVGLEVVPVRLEPVESQSPPPEPYDRAGRLDPDQEWERVTVEQYRQANFLAADARSINSTDVGHSSLAESDLFRTMKSLPGVSYRDEFSAEFRIRGANWDETRVTLDGVPLYNAVHLYGVFSSINPDAIGSAFFQPGIREASSGGAAAATLDVTTRSGRDDHMDGVGELSIFSGRLALDGVLDRGRWMIAGRRSFIDLITGPGSDPGDFSLADLTGRYDQQVGPLGELSFTGFLARDAFGRVTQGTPKSSFDWFSRLGRLGLTTFLGGNVLENSFGVSSFSGGTDSRSWGVPTRSKVIHRTFRGELRPTGIQSVDSFTLGYEIINQETRHTGARPSPFGDPIDNDSIALRGKLNTLAVWASRRHPLGAFGTVELGLRAESGGRVRGSPRVRLSPRAIARVNLPDRRTMVSVGFGRSYQYARTLGRILGGPGAYNLNPIAVWALAGDTVPALRSDLWSGAVERWMNDGILVAVSVYSRSTRGGAVFDVPVGPLATTPSVRFGRNLSQGVELSARRMTGRLTGAIAYSLSRSRDMLDRIEFSSGVDRRHLLNVTTSYAAGADLAIGLNLRMASGSPYTRLETDGIECMGPGDCKVLSPVAGPRNARRGPWFASLNLLFDWTHSYSDWDLGLYFRLVNVLNRDNRSLYNISQRELDGTVSDLFEKSVPAIPVFGFRVAF